MNHPRLIVWTAVNLILCLGFLAAGVLCFGAGRLFPYDEVSQYLVSHSNRAMAAFFTQEYYVGVLERARWGGIVALFSSAVFALLAGAGSHTHVRRWLETGWHDAWKCRDASHELVKWIRREKLLLFILLVGVAVRLLYLFQPVSSDEARAYYAWTARPFMLAVSDYRAPQHLLYTILDYGVVRLLGNAEWSIRLPAFLAGIGLPLLVFALARRIGGRGTGYLAAVLTATNPMLVHYSVNGRAYTLLACSVVALWYGAWSIRYGGGSRAHLLVAGAGIAGLMAMPTMIYPLVGTFFWLSCGILRDTRATWKHAFRPIRNLAVTGMAIVWGSVLAYLPAFVASDKWYSVDGSDVAGKLPWDVLPDRIADFGYQAFALWNMDYPSWLILLAVVSSAGGVWTWRRHGGLSLIAWNMISVPMVLLALRVVPYPRTVAYLAIAYLALVAAGLEQVRAVWSRMFGARTWMGGPTTAVILVGLVINLVVHNREGITASGSDMAPGIRDAMSYLRGAVSSGDHIISTQPASAPVFYYHLRNQMDNRIWLARETPPPQEILDGDRNIYFVVNTHTRQSLRSILSWCRWDGQADDIASRSDLVYSNAYCLVYRYAVE